MKTLNYPKLLPVKITFEQFEKCDEYENKSEYIRYLIQKDIESDKKRVEKAKK